MSPMRSLAYTSVRFLICSSREVYFTMSSASLWISVQVFKVGEERCAAVSSVQISQFDVDGTSI